MKISKPRFKKIILTVLLAFSLVSLSNISALAVPIFGINMPNGGSWLYNGTMDTSVTKNFSSATWYSLETVQSVYFIPPNAVKEMQLALSSSVSADMAKSYIKFGVDTAISSGIQVAKNKLTQKLGSSLAAKFIPWLSAFSWGYTAYDVFSTMYTGQQLSRLTEATRMGTGLIYKKASSRGDSSAWYYWNGSSKFGSYPTANLGPNNYQYGKVNVY